MATDYPIEITERDGSVRIAGLANFTDPDNEPVAPGSPAIPPFTVPATGTTVLVTDPSADPIQSFDADAFVMNFEGSINASGLGSSISYVTASASPPGADYSNPLYYDSTAVTGGLYAWDGTEYLKVGNLVS